MCPEGETYITNHEWVPHGQLHINFEKNAIAFPDGRIVLVRRRHLEALLAIPPNTSLSLKEIAGKISIQRETYVAFLTASPKNLSSGKFFSAVNVTEGNLKVTLSELREFVMEPIIQRAGIQSHYRLAPHYS